VLLAVNSGRAGYLKKSALLNIDQQRVNGLDGIMTQISKSTHRRHSIEAQFALSEKVLKGIHKKIDEDLERARDLEVKHALALYRAGKTTLHEIDDVIAEAKRRVG
jgi:hypothetical protein